MVNEPGFHPSSPAVLQRLVRVIVAMGPYSSFADEVSDCSELTTQLLQRRFQHFSDDWLRGVMCALRNWQVWAAKHSSPFSPMEPVGQPARRVPHRRRQMWPHGGKRHLDAVGLDQTRDGWSLPYRLFAPCIVQATRGRRTCRPPPMRCHQACSLRSCTIQAKPRARSQCSEGSSCFLAVACLRWRHQPRSVVKHLDERFITGKCLLGKSKVQGQWRAFEWRVPREIGLCFRFLTESSPCCRRITS